MVGGCDIAEPHIEQLTVSVSVSDARIRPGDVTDITVVAVNLTRTTLSFSSNECVLAIEVFDASGEEVYPGGWPCADILITHSLAPGESLSETFDFDGMGRLGWTASSDAFALEPGIYWVRGSVTARRLNPSPPVEIQIEPAAH